MSIETPKSKIQPRLNKLLHQKLGSKTKGTFLPKPPGHKRSASFLIEKQFAEDFILGMDEAGRGPLAGPVVCAAVCFSRDQWFHSELEQIQDSKKIASAKRERLVELIKEKAKWYNVQFIDQKTIDRRNILNASLMGFSNILDQAKKEGLSVHAVLIDGNQSLKDVSVAQRCIVGGDGLSTSIAAASILAKVERDQYMKEQSKLFPEYGFDKHKGYGTKAHWAALEENGPCRLHRRSFLTRYFKKNRGAASEAIVEEFLVNKGFELIERNWRHREGEIDLVVRHEGQLRFVEVRTSHSDDLHRSFPASKQKQVRRCIQLYLSSLESKPPRLKSIHCDFYQVRGADVRAFPDVFQF